MIFKSFALKWLISDKTFVPFKMEWWQIVKTSEMFTFKVWFWNILVKNYFLIGNFRLIFSQTVQILLVVFIKVYSLKICPNSVGSLAFIKLFQIISKNLLDFASPNLKLLNRYCHSALLRIKYTFIANVSFCIDNSQ